MPEPTARDLFRSDLKDSPLPEVLITISKYRVPGEIECSRDDVRKSIFIDSGQIIFATSSLVSESLGDLLLAQGKITRAQYDESAARLRTGEKRQGAILVEMGAIAPKDLFVSVREQVQQIVWSIFDWSAGDVVFTPGREKHHEFIKLNIPIRQAVLQGVRMMSDVRALIARIGGKTTLVERNPNADARTIEFSEEESRLLERVDGKKTLFELTNEPPASPLQNGRTIYALHALGIIQVKTAQKIKVQVKAPTPPA